MLSVADVCCGDKIKDLEYYLEKQNSNRMVAIQTVEIGVKTLAKVND